MMQLLASNYFSRIMEMEHRKNWKENIGKAAKEKAAKRQQLLIDLDTTRKGIKTSGTDFAQYDALKAQQRRIIAALATL